MDKRCLKIRRMNMDKRNLKMKEITLQNIRPSVALLSFLLSVSFSTKFSEMEGLDLKKNRCFLSCAYIITVTLALGSSEKSHQGVCILDSRSWPMSTRMRMAHWPRN